MTPFDPSATLVSDPYRLAREFMAARRVQDHADIVRVLNLAEDYRRSDRPEDRAMARFLALEQSDYAVCPHCHYIVWITNRHTECTTQAWQQYQQCLADDHVECTDGPYLGHYDPALMSLDFTQMVAELEL